MAFLWHYKACPCCGATMPDSRVDQLGACQVCERPRVLLDGPPEGWFERIVAGSRPMTTTRWMHEWRNRPVDQLCPHERKLVLVK